MGIITDDIDETLKRPRKRGARTGGRLETFWRRTSFDCYFVRMVARASISTGTVNRVVRSRRLINAARRSDEMLAFS